MNSRTAPLLRNFLLADAVVSGVTGLVMLLGAGVLEDLLGVPAPLMRYAGAALLPFAALVLFWSGRERISPSRVRTVIGLNALWVVASVGLLIARPIQLSTLGMAFVIVQAVVVAIFAQLQYAGLRSLAGTPGEHGGREIVRAVR